VRSRIRATSPPDSTDTDPPSGVSLPNVNAKTRGGPEGGRGRPGAASLRRCGEPLVSGTESCWLRARLVGLPMGEVGRRKSLIFSPVISASDVLTSAPPARPGSSRQRGGLSTPPSQATAPPDPEFAGGDPGGPVAGWRLGLETGRVEAQRQESFRRATERSVASSEACGVARGLPFGVGTARAVAREQAPKPGQRRLKHCSPDPYRLSQVYPQGRGLDDQ
jgi:hypothetical protein